MSTQWLVGTTGILAVAVVLGAEARTDMSAVAERGHVAAPPGVGVRPALPATVRFAGQSAPGDDPDTAALNDVVQRVCVTCHSDRRTAGGLSLEGFRVEDGPRYLEKAEAMITKLRLDMMPPPGVRRPGRETLIALAETLERTVDASAAQGTAPGRRPIQYMNRAEYENAVREIFGLEIDADAYLPGETISEGFDNIADVQVVSGTLLNGFLRAATEVSRLSVGDPDAAPIQSTYGRSRDYAQWAHVDGAPVGTRGGIVTTHTFPADGEYVFRAAFLVDETGGLFGNPGLNEQVEIAIDGERVALLDVNPWMNEGDPQGATVESDPIPIPAGPRTVSAAFIKRFEGPVQDIFAPIDQTLATTEAGRSPGITALPHMGSLTITGPYDVTGVSDNPVRERIFTCRPASPEEDGACARQIIGNIAVQAYRRPPADHELEELASMYEARAADAGFEAGIRVAIQAILSSPHFIFRIEEQPRDVAPGEAFAIDDFDLATRLAQFLWARPPDDELLGLAAERRLSDEGVLVAQVERMLDDPRSESLATRFAAQWLRLPDLEGMRPDPRYFPYIHEGLKDDMRRETELFFSYLVEDDRPVTELLTADYTFVNGDLAEHYGIPGVAGEGFRRVQHRDEDRYGLLGQGSILTQTSFARRTSPVNRGKFVMEVLLGTAPPPPPPNVPDLEVTEAVDGESGRALTVKERMEMHRTNPTCAACHQFIDPLGLPLETFGPTGETRIRERTWATVPAPIDSRGTLWTGQPVESPSQLREIIANDFQEAFLRNFGENLLRYALGRQTHARDRSTVRSIVRAAADNDYRFSSFAAGIVTSDAFRMMESR